MKMLQLFLRARANNYFKARSAGRDIEADRARVGSILRSVEEALQAAEAEHAGLTLRISDVLAQAAVTIGNDHDEYLTPTRRIITTRICSASKLQTVSGDCSSWEPLSGISSLLEQL
jgi:hypothetical protein